MTETITNVVSASTPMDIAEQMRNMDQWHKGMQERHRIVKWTQDVVNIADFCICVRTLEVGPKDIRAVERTIR